MSERERRGRVWAKRWRSEVNVGCDWCLCSCSLEARQKEKRGGRTQRWSIPLVRDILAHPAQDIAWRRRSGFSEGIIA